MSLKMNPAVRKSLARLMDAGVDVSAIASQGLTPSTPAILDTLQSRIRELHVSILNGEVNERQKQWHRDEIQALAQKEGVQRLPALIRLQHIGHLAPAYRLVVIQTALDLLVEAGAADLPLDWPAFVKSDGLLESDNLQEKT